MPTREAVLVSACLAGLKTRYDGNMKTSPACLAALEGRIWVPVCPEQLGGLATPRCAADIVGGDGEAVLDGSARVVCRDGVDVTDAFIAGARQVLDIARRQGIETVFLKARSPSCGVARLGVTAALLRRHGLALSEFD